MDFGDLSVCTPRCPNEVFNMLTLQALDFGTLFDLPDGPEWNGLISGH